MIAKHSLSALLSRLISLAPSAPPAGEGQLGDDRKVATTIRFEARTREFIEMQSQHLGISAQEFVAMTFKALMLANAEPQAIEIDLMADRFIEVFSKHRIPIADITRMLPERSLDRSDLLSKKDLINKLDEIIIQHVATMFSINPQWVKGHNSNPVETGGFCLYKNLDGFARRLAILSRTCRRVSVSFIAKEGLTYEQLCSAYKSGDKIPAVDVGVVIEKENEVNGISFRSYEIADAERWNYWRCRYYLKALMMFCEKSGLAYRGILLSQHEMNSLFNGHILPTEVLDTHRRTWYPDQLLWPNKENLEADELENVKAFYADEKVSLYETALKTPYLVQNWDTFEITGKTLSIRDC